MLKTLIIFLLIFSIIVVFHEFGHFYFARRAGILVREFSIGMGPKLFSHQAEDGVTYTIRILPLGGYVRLAGVNEEETLVAGMEVGLSFDKNDQVSLINLSKETSVEELPVQINKVDLLDSMTIEAIPMGKEDIIRYSVSKKANVIEEDGTRLRVAPREVCYEAANVWHKMKTNIAGPVNNFILSILVFMEIGLIGPGVPSNSNQLGEIVSDSPAAKAGLHEGDIVTAINDKTISNWNELVSEIREMPGEDVTVHIERNGEAKTIPLTIGKVLDEENNEEYGQIGIMVSLKTDLLSRILSGFTQTWNIVVGVVLTIASMIRTGFNINNFGGPVAMAQLTNTAVQSGTMNILYLMGWLSANLGIVNILPMPALDGGKVWLNIYEAIVGKPLSQEKEGIITLIGALLLIILMIAVTWNDFNRLFH